MIVYKAENSKKSRSFGKTVKIFVLFMAFLSASGLCLLWAFLSAYEKSYPSYKTGQIVKLMQNGDYLSAADMIGIDYDRFNSREHTAKALQHTIGNTDSLKTSEKNLGDGRYSYKIKGENGEISLIAQPSGKRTFFGFNEYTTVADPADFNDWDIAAPQNTVVYANGVKLSAEHSANKKVVPPGFSVILNEDVTPSLDSYTLPGIYLAPEITADTGTVQADRTTHTAVITVFSDEIPAARTDLIKNTAVTYANFVSDDASFARISKYLYPETEFYRSLKNFSNFWYVEHDSAAAENINIFNYSEYSDSAFSAEITFDYRIKQALWNINKVYPSHYRISFIEVGGVAKAVNIQPV